MALGVLFLTPITKSLVFEPWPPGAEPLSFAILWAAPVLIIVLTSVLLFDASVDIVNVILYQVPADIVPGLEAQV